MQQIFLNTSNKHPSSEITATDNTCKLLTTLIASQRYKKLFLLRGKQSYTSSGAEQLIHDATAERGFEIAEFYSFSANPKYEDVGKGIRQLKSFMPDVMLAIGGGSVIDMAKLLRHYSELHIPLISIPTTAGTGAESTAFAVCYFDGVKKSIAATDMLSEYVILAPELTLNNNEYLTACTGFDAFAQAIEAYWNINATLESDHLSITAIELLYKNLCQTFNHINREEMLLASNLAGRAINITKTTAPHALSYTFTSHYGYPHGHAVALTFPFFFAKNIHCSANDYVGADYDNYQQKMKVLLDIFSLEQTDDLFEFMHRLVQNIGLGYDPNRPFDSQKARQGVNLERAKNNPHRLDEAIIAEAINSITK